MWSDATAVATLQMGRADTPFYMGIYFCFGFGTLLVMVVRSAAVVMGTIKASRKLHSDLLEKVRKALTQLDVLWLVLENGSDYVL